MGNGPEIQTPTSRLLSLAYNRTSAAIYEQLVKAGINDTRPSHGNVMEHLAFEDGLRLADLATRAGVTPQSMGQWVDELEVLGYVERRPDKNDRRAKRIHLTRKGKRSNKIEWKVVREIDDALKHLLGEKRLQVLRSTLEEIINTDDIYRD
jgi:DNA-binding MarR family transcriptional regulator